VIADLEALNSSTEQHFLTIGGKLTEFYAAARRIAADMAALNDLISGERARHTAEVLERVLGRASEAESRAAAGGQTLANVRDAARRIEHTFLGFQDTISMFRVLGSVTRIETARLGRAGAEFGNLTEEVKTLTASIESRGQAVLAAASVLYRDMQSAVAQVSSLRASEMRTLHELMLEAAAGMASLEERHRGAREASLAQAGGYAEVSAAIGELVEALQFHDLTRQKIEHVAEALGPLVSRPPETGAILTLQCAQMREAEKVLSSSVGRIDQALQGILARATAMAEASRAILGTSADERASFFRQMESRFTAILKIFQTCDRAEMETRSALAGLARNLAGMRESLAEIDELGTRLRRMAINATIRAAQIGDAGRALDVLADVIKRLAVDTSGITNQVTETLDDIAGSADSLSGEPGEVPGASPSDAGEVFSEMQATILELHSSSESGFSRLHQIMEWGVRLRDGIQSVRSGFSAGALFSDGIKCACQALEEIAADSGLGPLYNILGPGENQLDGYGANYTMQAERDVHQALAGVTVDLPEAAEPVAASEDPDNLGDNVELF